MPKAERINTSRKVIEESFQRIITQLDKRIEQKGKGAYHSRHETYGIIKEEFDELGGAVQKNDGKNFEEELVDIAVAAIFGLASHKTIYD